MKRPSFQFYPADWRNNANLRRCSPAARGVWMDIMCLMHDSDEYGILRWPLKDIAAAAGAAMTQVRELVQKGVLKGDDKRISAPFVYIPKSGRKNGAPVTLVGINDGPLWYSSRMVKDEYVRTIRGDSARFDDAPNDAPNHSPKGGFGATPKAHQTSHQREALVPDAPAPSSSSSPSGKPSVPDGTGSRLPERMPTEEIIFGYGVPLLTSAGTPEKQARSFLGGLRKQHGDDALIDKLRECLRAKPLQPLEWLAAALPPKSTATRPSARASPHQTRDDGRLAAARAIFGTEIEKNHAGNDDGIIDITPAGQVDKKNLC